jgi:hypothetical protein
MFRPTITVRTLVAEKRFLVKKKHFHASARRSVP